MIFSPDGTLIATAGGANYISLWNQDGTLLRHIVAGQSGETVHGLAFSPGGTALAAALSEGQVKLFTVEMANLSRLSPDTSRYVPTAQRFAGRFAHHFRWCGQKCSPVSNH
ncbi:MAG: WD40 repeat domain-containing protein [Anaerolineae bacterium]